MKIECPKCGWHRIQIVLCQTAIYDPGNGVTPNFDEEVNREGEIACEKCFTKIPGSEEIWDFLEEQFQKSLEAE